MSEITTVPVFESGPAIIQEPEYTKEWPFLKTKQQTDEGNKAQLGIPANASLDQLDKIRSSKTASKAKKQRAHWLANMRRGNNKK